MGYVEIVDSVIDARKVEQKAKTHLLINNRVDKQKNKNINTNKYLYRL